MIRLRRRSEAHAGDGAIDNAPVRIGGPSVAYVRWADLRRSSAARRQVRAARELARRLRRAA